MRRLVVIFLFVLFSFFSYATVCTSTGNGNWSATTTWDCGVAPQDGDTIKIAAGDTVTADCQCGTYTNMRIEICGLLDFPTGKKIIMDSTGVVQIYSGGKVTGSGSAAKIIIGGVQKWSGTEGDVEGPMHTCHDCTGFYNGYLPIDLLYFGAEQDEMGVELKWVTASEKNNDYFVVERSINGRDFEIIGSLKGSGNSSTARSYRLKDFNPHKGINYYRLTQVDFDGKYERFDLIMVLFNAPYCPKGMKVFPNPTTDENINVEFTGYSGEEILVVLIDQSGKEVYSKVVLVGRGENKMMTAIDPYNRLFKGLYVVIGSSNNSLQSEFLIIAE